MILTISDSASKTLIVEDLVTPLDFGTPVQWLNGEWYLDGATYYFEDKSGNGYDAEIIDFDLSITGFPYKSAAKIRQPSTGDAYDALYAADDGFWYSAANTPNDIPIVSLFQDIHYAHKIFCRHTTRKLDTNSVELREPRVIDITTYSSVLSGSNLTEAQSFFGAPTELTSDMVWISKDGNDTTGDGSKITPYLTIAKGITVGNNKTIYIKSGDYPEQYILSNKQLILHGLGFVENSKNTNYVILYGGATPVTTLKRIILSEAVSYKMLVQGNCGALVFDDLISIDAINFLRWLAGIVTSTIFNNSQFNEEIGTFPFDVVFNGCYFNVAVATVLLRASGSKATLNHCKIDEITSTGMFQAKAVNSELYIFDCDFYGNPYVDEANAYAPKITIVRSNIITKTKAVLGYTANTGVRDIVINYNTITSEGTPGAFSLINSIGKGTFEFNNNNVSGSEREFSVVMSGLDADGLQEFSGNIFTSKHLDFTCNNSDCVIQENILNTIEKTRLKLSVSIALLEVVGQILNNTIITRDHENAMIIIGTEGAAVSFGMLDDSTIYENKLLAPRYFGNSPGAQHGIFIYAQEIEAKYNYMNGTSIGYVMKSAGNTYPSVIHHNIIVDCDSALLSKGAPGVSYYNNTIVLKSSTGSSGGLTLSNDTDIGAGTYSINTKFKNNIIADFRTAFDTVFIQATTDDLVGADIDYNIYYKANVNQDHFAFIDAAWITFTQWRALGFDANSVMLTDAQAQSLFTDQENGDYSLPSGSLAIGAGVDLGAAYDDGLDSTTDWGEDSELPTIVTKQQPTLWDVGAYIS